MSTDNTEQDPLPPRVDTQLEGYGESLKGFVSQARQSRRDRRGGICFDQPPSHPKALPANGKARSRASSAAGMDGKLLASTVIAAAVTDSRDPDRGIASKYSKASSRNESGGKTEIAEDVTRDHVSAAPIASVCSASRDSPLRAPRSARRPQGHKGQDAKMKKRIPHQAGRAPKKGQDSRRMGAAQDEGSASVAADANPKSLTSAAVQPFVYSINNGAKESGVEPLADEDDRPLKISKTQRKRGNRGKGLRQGRATEQSQSPPALALVTTGKEKTKVSQAIMHVHDRAEESNNQLTRAEPAVRAASSPSCPSPEEELPKKGPNCDDHTRAEAKVPHSEYLRQAKSNACAATRSSSPSGTSTSSAMVPNTAQLSSLSSPPLIAGPTTSTEGLTKKAGRGKDQPTETFNEQSAQQQKQQEAKRHAPPVLRADAKPFELPKPTVTAVRGLPPYLIEGNEVVLPPEPSTSGVGGNAALPPGTVPIEQNAGPTPPVIISPASAAENEARSAAVAATTPSPQRVSLTDSANYSAVPQPRTVKVVSSQGRIMPKQVVTEDGVRQSSKQGDEEHLPGSIVVRGASGISGSISSSRYRQRNHPPTGHGKEPSGGLAHHPKRQGKTQRTRGEKAELQRQHQQEPPQSQQGQELGQVATHQMSDGGASAAGSTTTTEQNISTDRSIKAHNPGQLAHRNLSEQADPLSISSLEPDTIKPARNHPSRSQKNRTKRNGFSNTGDKDDVSGKSVEANTADSGRTLMYEMINITEEILARWVEDTRVDGNVGGGECNEMLNDVRTCSGALSVNVRVELDGRGGKGNNGKNSRAKRAVSIVISASAPAQVRVAKALLNTHLKSRLELLRLEEKRRSTEGNLAAFEREIARGLRVKFLTRREWVGLLIGKAGARINAVQNSTGCVISIEDGDPTRRAFHGGARGGHKGGSQGTGDTRNAGSWLERQSDGYSDRSAQSARVIISGSDPDCVREAREKMEFSEYSIAVTAGQAVILGRQPRTKLLDLKEQSECPIVDLIFQPFWYQASKNMDGGGGGASDYPGLPDQSANQSGVGGLTGGGAMVRIVGPTAAVESARMLLQVILRYLDDEREMQKSDLKVRKKLAAMQISYFGGKRMRAKSGTADSATVRAGRHTKGSRRRSEPDWSTTQST